MWCNLLFMPWMQMRFCEEWVRNYMPRETMDVVTYPCPNISQTMAEKGIPVVPVVPRMIVRTSSKTVLLRPWHQAAATVNLRLHLFQLANFAYVLNETSAGHADTASHMQKSNCLISIFLHTHTILQPSLYEATPVACNDNNFIFSFQPDSWSPENRLCYFNVILT